MSLIRPHVRHPSQKLWTFFLLSALSACTKPGPAPSKKVDEGPRHRIVMKLSKGTFSPALETRLEAELLLALANQPDLEVLSDTTADDAARRRHVCAEEDFVNCRSRLLRVEAEVFVKLNPGPVRGTWFFEHSLTPTGGARVWQPTFPFSAAVGETFDDAVVRAARQLGASITWNGLRAGTSFAAAPANDQRLASLCASLNDPQLELDWPTRAAVRAELHRAGQDQLADTALEELKTAARFQAGDPCGRLAAMDAWRERAEGRGWLPRKLASETWRGDVDIVLRAGSEDAPRSHTLINALAGALATRGFTLRNAGPREPGEPCAGADCVDGEDTSAISTTLGRLVLDVVHGPSATRVQGRFFLRAADGRVRVIDVAAHELGVSGTTTALDRALSALDSP